MDKAAEFCIAFKKHMVTTSYVSEAMKKMDGEARGAGILMLNELGLFSDEPLPLEKASALDIIAARMTKKLAYAAGERDMIVLQHEFIASYPKAGKEKIISTLIDFGIPHGDSSMARTVGLPAAIGTKLILEGKIKERGVQIPVLPDIYTPILEELKTLDIAFKEKRERLG